jgi:hypothetical protein
LQIKLAQLARVALGSMKVGKQPLLVLLRAAPRSA